MSKEMVDSERAVSLREIRWAYLVGLLPWATYQHFEDALTVNLGKERKSFVVSPLKKEPIESTDH